MRRRIWSEMLPLEVVARPESLGPLASRGIDLLAAVFPSTRGGAPEVVQACRRLGVSAGLWPMLDDADGRWANASNAEPYAALVRGLLRDLGESARPDVIAIDLEPGIAEMRASFRGRPWPALRRAAATDAAPGWRVLRDLVEDLHARGIETISAVMPVLAAGRRATRGWELALGTPRLESGATCAMAYTSLFSGYSRGLVRRRDATALLALTARAAARHLGPRACLGLGATGTGALGDEPVYRDPAELAEDVAIARACGVDDLALFDLSGVLRRPSIDAWLDAFVETPAAPALPTPTRRARALAIGASAIGWVLASARR